MIRQDAQEFVDFMNELIKIDRGAIQELIESRVVCNKKLAEHPTVQVSNYFGDGQYWVGMLGIFNGWFGAYDAGPKQGWGPIAAIYSEDDRLLRFEILENRGNRWLQDDGG